MTDAFNPQLFTVICCSLIAASSTNSYQMQSDVVRLQKLSFAFIVLQPLALGFSKASILLFYRRVFCGNVFNISSWFLLACVGMWSIAMFLASLLQCAGNTSDFWTRQSTTARCHALPISGTFITFDVILDLAIMLLPIPLVDIPSRNLHQCARLTATGCQPANAIKEKAASVPSLLCGRIVSQSCGMATDVSRIY